jgi:putative transposase
MVSLLSIEPGDVMKDLPQRKKLRLLEYDYAQDGCYFITICIQNKEQILCRGEHRSPAVPSPDPFILSEIGEIVELAIHNIPKFYPDVLIDKYIIMPNHIHMVIIIHNAVNCQIPASDDTHERGRTMFASTSPPSVSEIIRQMKGYATKKIGFSICQRSYHDHIIRNDVEYRMIWNYIDTNPEKWCDDCYFENSTI